MRSVLETSRKLLAVRRPRLEDDGGVAVESDEAEERDREVWSLVRLS
jgi:hypothetical protein